MNAPGVIHLCSSRAHADMALIACAQAASPRDRAIVIDDVQGVARARALGMRVHAHIAPPLRRPWLARRALTALLAQSGSDHRTLVAWGAHLEPLITATRGEQILVDFDRGVIERFPGSLRGPGPIRTLPAPATPLAPLFSAESRATWRNRLCLAPSDRAVALAGVTAAECDVPAFVHVLGMLHFASVRVVGVVDSGHMSRLRAAMRRAREAMPKLRVIARSEPMLAWIGACDAAVVAPGDRFDSGDSTRRFDAPLLASTIAAAGVSTIVAQRDASDADQPNLIRVESAHPAIMARALRQRLDTLPTPATPADAAIHWRAALAAVADPASVSALALAGDPA